VAGAVAALGIRSQGHGIDRSFPAGCAPGKPRVSLGGLSGPSIGSRSWIRMSARLEGDQMLREGLIERMARMWWLFALRGVAAVLFGILALAWPDVTIGVLVVLFGIYALADGIGSLIAAWRHRGPSQHRAHHLLEGVLGLVIGVISLVWPDITALALLLLIAIWAITTGIVEISAAIRLRRVIDNEWWLALSGVVSILAGIVLLVQPGAGALAIAIVIGIYAILFGLVLIGLGLRLRRMAMGRPGRG
jgi:uncharacterized membrane protein HdeD (DUF308 family)